MPEHFVYTWKALAITEATTVERHSASKHDDVVYLNFCVVMKSSRAQTESTAESDRISNEMTCCALGRYWNHAAAFHRVSFMQSGRRA